MHRARRRLRLHDDRRSRVTDMGGSAPSHRQVTDVNLCPGAPPTAAAAQHTTGRRCLRRRHYGGRSAARQRRQ